jgi:hypothetical protein
MNVEELLKLERPLTDEEAAFMEDELLKLTRELHTEVMKICEKVEPQSAFLANKLKQAAVRTLENVEAAVAVPLLTDPPRKAQLN